MPNPTNTTYNTFWSIRKVRGGQEWKRKLSVIYFIYKKKEYKSIRSNNNLWKRPFPSDTGRYHRNANEKFSLKSYLYILFGVKEWSYWIHSLYRWSNNSCLHFKSKVYFSHYLGALQFFRQDWWKSLIVWHSDKQNFIFSLSITKMMTFNLY